MRFEHGRCISLWLLALGLLLQAPIHAQDYQIGPGDLLHINVFDHEELSLDARVSQSGNITYPLIGVVQVGGLSTREAEMLLAQRLSSGAFVRQPQVSIIVTDFQSQKVSVVGQVTKPGQYSLTSAQKVLDVLSMAGGLLADSAADSASLMRKDGSVQNIDLRKLFDGDMSGNFSVHNGDTLVVARAPQFYVYGQVQRPGAYRLTRDMTVSQAISTGGGLTKQGTERRAIVKRRDAKGVEQEYSVKGTSVLRADDVLFIKESLF